ncbi:hypothetical protein MMA231_00208 [Asticcacaulis sp. MM231]
MSSTSLLVGEGDRTTHKVLDAVVGLLAFFVSRQNIVNSS